jgi:hypothetical protein
MRMFSWRINSLNQPETSLLLAVSLQIRSFGFACSRSVSFALTCGWQKVHRVRKWLNGGNLPST